MPAARIIVVEDDPAQNEILAEVLRAEGFEVTTFPDGQKALAALEGQAIPADLVLTDVGMPLLDGIGLCQALKESRPGLPVIVVTAESHLQTAVAALRAGAWDFLSKPVETELLRAGVKRALDARRMEQKLRELQSTEMAGGDNGLLGESEPMKQVRDLVARVAPSGASVLVQGETGSGKELVARALHNLSPRAQNPFIAVNCAALPATLLESELFGYARGAFTDARAAKAGLFVEAAGGTLFLDEVAELSLDNQAKLLRALQERKVRPLGTTTEVPFDARVLSATHRDLEAEVEAGRFRQDLYFRLNVIRIEVPPLRDRGMDIVRLATHFMSRICTRDGRSQVTFSSALAHKLLAYSWPGNVRELENCVERLSALARGNEADVTDLPEKVRVHQSSRFAVNADAPEEIITLEQLEKQYVLRVLQVVNDNRSRAAELLGIDRRTLYRKLDAWNGTTEKGATSGGGGGKDEGGGSMSAAAN